jgi:hypothetical protein
MTETLTKSSIPEFHGLPDEIASWQEAVNTAIRAGESMARGEEFEYISPLPFIVGSIPEEEREYFDTMPDAVASGVDILSPKAWEKENPWQNLPGVLKVIQADLKAIDSTDFKIGSPDLDITHVKPGGSPRNPVMHFDGILGPRGSRRIIYTATNRLGTGLYDGPVRLAPHKDAPVHSRAFHAMDQESIDKTRPLLTAPAYAIVRMSEIAVHGSPIAQEETTRSFLRVFVEPESHR